MNPLLFIIASVLIGASAQLVLKSGARSSDGVGLLAQLLRPVILTGLSLNALAAALWIVALRSVDLSYAFPWLSLNFILIPLGAAYFYGETLRRRKVIGMWVIALGLVVVAMG
jgi:drug/metabolite transporter (DMT)-like permease